MTNGLLVLAVVPARSGSKGILDKNLQRIGGRSLIARAGDTLKACPSVDRAVISTDAAAYADEGRAHGLDAPFLRPLELSSDTAGAVETLLHAVESSEAHYRERYGIIVIAEPTCPLRRPADIEQALQLLVESGADSVVGVSRADTKFHPRKLLRIDQGLLRFYDPSGASVQTRQSLEPLFYRNGACYALTRSCLMERRTIFSQVTRAFVIDRPLVNIDEPMDLAFARYLVDNGLS